MDLPCQEHCYPWRLLHQLGANLLTLSVLEGEGEEEGIQGRERGGVGEDCEKKDEIGEEKNKRWRGEGREDVISLVSSDPLYPIPVQSA